MQALLYRGWVYGSLSQLNAALADYRRAAAADDEHGEARLRLAETLLQSRKPEEAVDHFEFVRSRQPDNPAVLVGLALCLPLGVPVCCALDLGPGADGHREDGDDG